MRKLSLLLVIVLLLTVAVSGTVAWFTDEEQASAVIVSGNIQVIQHEQERGSDGALQPYTQNKPIYPSTGVTREAVTLGKYTVSMPKAPSTTYADKIVTVENVGVNPAYLRTIIAVPTFGYNSSSPANHWLRWDAYSGNEWTWSTTPVNAVIDGVEYDIYVATYNKVLAPDEITPPSLLGVYLDGKVNFDGVNLYFPYGAKDQKTMKGSDTLEILVATQATQSNVFDSPSDALTTVFGEVSEINHPWFNETVKSVSSDAALQTLLAGDIPSGTTIHLASGTYTLPERLPNAIRIVGDDEVYINNPAVLAAYSVDFHNLTFNNAMNFTGDGEFDEVICKAAVSATFTNPAYITDCVFEGGFTCAVSDEAIRSMVIIENCKGVSLN